MNARTSSHPIFIAAAVSVIVFSLLGIGAILGWLPVSRSTPTNSVASANGEQSAAAGCRECGVIESIRVVTVQGKPTGVGAVTGGALVGLLGHQVGEGKGKDLATIGGAVGGAYLGNEMEKNMKQHTSYRITVRMDDGTHRTLYSSTQDVSVGQKIKVINNRAVPISNS
jgi:outer membrane lipoprotein SlyB